MAFFPYVAFPFDWEHIEQSSAKRRYLRKPIMTFLGDFSLWGLKNLPQVLNSKPPFSTLNASVSSAKNSMLNRVAARTHSCFTAKKAKYLSIIGSNLDDRLKEKP